MNMTTQQNSSIDDTSRIVEPAAWMAILATSAAIVFLAALHVLSPEFSPSWRMISEYAFGHYAWLLSLMFLSWGLGTWALVIAIWSQVHTRAGKVGMMFLIVAGLGEALASVFDITHPVGHGIAGLLGVIGFPIAALLLTGALGRSEVWRAIRRPLVWIANLSWISVVALIATLAIMTMQMGRANRGHLPQHAPKSLPPGVFALDGWADRLIVSFNCAWVLLAAWHAIQVHRNYSNADGTGRRSAPKVDNGISG